MISYLETHDCDRGKQVVFFFKRKSVHGEEQEQIHIATGDYDHNGNQAFCKGLLACVGAMHSDYGVHVGDFSFVKLKFEQPSFLRAQKCFDEARSLFFTIAVQYQIVLKGYGNLLGIACTMASQSLLSDAHAKCLSEIVEIMMGQYKIVNDEVASALSTEKTSSQTTSFLRAVGTPMVSLGRFILTVMHLS